MRLAPLGGSARDVSGPESDVFRPLSFDSCRLWLILDTEGFLRQRWKSKLSFRRGNVRDRVASGRKGCWNSSPTPDGVPNPP